MRRYIRYSKKRIDWVEAADVSTRVKELLNSLKIDWVDESKLHFLRSQGAKTRAIARIWGLSRVWQMTLKTTPHYIIEVISERFDELPDFEKDKVLLHELTHIPRNFSGALVPHIRYGKRSFHKKVDELINQYFLAKRKRSGLL